MIEGKICGGYLQLCIKQFNENSPPKAERQEKRRKKIHGGNSQPNT